MLGANLRLAQLCQFSKAMGAVAATAIISEPFKPSYRLAEIEGGFFP
jgi:hypothetical protein